MQRQLLQITDRIPDDILLTLLKCFAQILTREPEQSQRATGPFIRAFAKIRDDNGEKQQFQAIIEEDEDQLKATADVGDDGDTECTFNYKVSNVVTQEVVYSMNGNNEDDDDQRNDQESSAASNSDDADATADNNNNIADDNLLRNEQDVDNNSINEASSSEMCVNGDASIDEMPQATDDDSNEIIDGNFREILDENEEERVDEESDVIENGVGDESWREQPQIEIVEVEEVFEKVTLDDIQREINEMQMFLLNKTAEEARKVQIMQEEARIAHIMQEELMKAQILQEEAEDDVEDAYKVNVCVNLKKKSSSDGHKRHSKSKAILSSFLGDGKQVKGEKEPRQRIFDPAVPNTQEDFLKEKSVSEKINKKRQKIKNLDVSWQKLVDDQKKVYR